ncbi:nSTAND1 domain-containing NTPase [Streptomyces chartreusis]
MSAAVLQVLAGDGTVVGAGFLAREATAVTCAHVVRAAGQAPGGRVDLVFPQLPGMPRAHGRVLVAPWRGPDEQDVAFLQLEEVPAQARPLALGAAARCRGHRVFAFGFPRQAPHGGHFGYGRAGDLLPEGPAGQLLQLYEANDLTTGFSGGPVLDEATGLVIGMVTSITAPDAHLKGLGIAYATPTEVLQQLQPELTVQQVHPYRGLEPFTADHTRFFFGRDDAIRTVLTELGRQRRLLLLLGPSGAGKSSLVQAGVLPTLARGMVPGSDRWLRLYARPGQDLAGELERAGLPDPARGLLPAMQRCLADNPTHDRLLLVIDQFEELLTPLSPAVSKRHRAALDDLATAARAHTPCSILLIMRDDFYPRLAATAPQILEIAGPALLNIPAVLALPDLRDIITRPAQEAGASLEDGLAERIIADVLAATPDQQAPVTLLPPLELALAQLWQRLDDNGRLTHHAYQRIGAVTGSLTTWCNTAIAQLHPDHRPTARRLLTALIRPADEAQAIPATRQQVPLARLRALSSTSATPAPAQGALFDDVLATLTGHRVITTRTPPPTSDGPSEPTAELIHDALLRDWSDLRDWAAQDHRFQLWLHRITEQAARYARSSQSADLLAGSALQESLDWSRQRTLPADITTFLAASHKRQQASARRTRRINVILAGLLVLTLIAAGVAFWQRQSALDAQHQAQSRQLAAQSSALLDTDPELASLLAIAAYRTSRTREATASLYAAAAGFPLRYRLTGHKEYVSTVAFSPNGRTMASGGGDDGRVRLWDPATGRLLRALTPHHQGVSALAFSPDNRVLASSGYDGTVHLRDTSTGRLLHTLTGNQKDTYALAFTRDGRTLATGGGTGDGGTVQLWDPASGRLLRTLTGNEDFVSTLAFDRDGRTLASAGGENGRIRLWDPATGRLRRTLPGSPNGVGELAFSPDGRTLANNGGDLDDRVQLWDPATGRLRLTFDGNQGGVHTVAFSPDGQALAIGGVDGTMQFRDPATGRLLSTMPSTPGQLRAMAFSNDRRTLASGSSDGTVRVWDYRTGRILITHQSPVYTLALSQDGRLLASGDTIDTVRLFDSSTGRRLHTLAGGREDPVAQVAFSPDGRTLASGSFADSKVRLFDTSAGRLRRTLTGHRNDAVFAVAFSRSGHALASGGYDGTVRLWNPSTGRLRRTFNANQGAVYAVAFSPDGRTLASGGDNGTVRLFDLSTGRPLRTLTGHQGGVNGLAFSPDGRTLASGSADGTVRLRNPATGRLLRTFVGSKGPVAAVAFSPDGHTLAAGSYDGTVRLYDPAADLWRSFIGHQNSVSAVAFSPDGHTLVSGSYDGTVRLWTVQPPSQTAAINKICRGVDRNLSQDERAAYLAGVSLGPVCPSETTSSPY